MTRNQLPEGVGKKIVEALRREAEADITPVDVSDNSLNTNLPLTDIQDLPELNFDAAKEEPVSNENLIVEEDSSVAVPEDVYSGREEEVQPQDPSIMDRPLFTAVTETPVTTFVNNPPVQKREEVKSTIVTPMAKINIPPNVMVLKNLIATLPVGVTKQTGAQIIRQTLEAMGLPMNSVLKEAQEVQEELNSSTRECMVKIQEYKTNILQLEQSVNEYQKNITQINDLVSLFLLTDRK